MDEFFFRIYIQIRNYFLSQADLRARDGDCLNPQGNTIFVELALTTVSN